MSPPKSNVARRTCPFCRDVVSAGNPLTNLAQHIKYWHPEKFEQWRNAVDLG